MPRLTLCLRVGALCLLVVAATLAQTNPSRNSEHIRNLSRAAGFIFRGTVLSVVHVAPTHANQLESVQICFRIDENLRGTKSGAPLCIREWAGLWTSRDRYRVGEQLALFLYPPSRLGLTSPVSGEEGRFAMNASGVRSSTRESPAPPPRGITEAIGEPSSQGTLSPREFRHLVRNSIEK